VVAVGRARELEALIDEVRLLWNALVRRGEALHAREPVTMGMRAVLEFLARNGPTPVPAIARRRGVSRQHVQALVNPLLERGLVEATANPAHRRSPRIRLTAKGERTIERMRRRETALLGGVRLGAGELRRAAATLRALRRSLEA
jgi:DNA-binding MarR family transcriptional regulator